MQLPRIEDKLISLDIETNDPDIKRGLGPYFGYVCGVSVAWGDQSIYIPLKHPNSDNVDLNKFIRWAKDNLVSKDIIGANILYDLDFLYELGLHFKGMIYDIQFAEPLLDEQRFSYSLDSLAKKYLGLTKHEEKMIKWGEENLSKRERKKIKEHIWRMPASVIEEYACIDAELPFKIFALQKPLLEEQGLWESFILESKLFSMVLKMRKLGVRIDQARAEKLQKEFDEKVDFHQRWLNEKTGMYVNCDANASLGEACDQLSILYPHTKLTGVPSFTKGWMQNQNNEFFDHVLKLRKFSKLSGTFIEGSILKYLINDRIHCRFHQLRSDDYGTVTGRFSSSNPNLQQVPTRETKELRELFLPEEGCFWMKADYSSIEPRVAMHFASNIEAIKEMLWKDPALDVYQPMLDLLPDFSRDRLKAIFLGVSYSMGKTTMSNDLGLSLAETEIVLQKFHRALPYLKKLSKQAMAAAQANGFVSTIMGRRRRFNLWQKERGYQETVYKSKAEAQEHHFRVERAYVYRALNAIIQGTSAEIMKKAMLDLWESGIYNEIPVPHLTVHDELDHSIYEDKQHLVPEIKSIMENTIPLSVPLHVDCEIGENWGSVK